MSHTDTEVELTGEERWAWGRNGEIRRPSIVTVKNMGDEVVWLSVYANRRTLENGTSPIDLHMSSDDARELGRALLEAAGEPVSGEGTGMTTLLETIREALSYAAEDYAERADIESKHRADDDEPDEDEEGYRDAANLYSAALEQLDTLGETLARGIVGEGYTADDVGPKLTCGEVEDVAETLRGLGQSEAADRLIAGHGVTDEADDRHYVGAE